MKYLKFCLLAFIIITVSTSSFSQTVKTSRKSEVFVLSTLHQFHGENKDYSFETLSQIIEKFNPDIICVELTAADLESRKKQQTKQEYNKTVFPLADKHKYELVSLEPSEPKFSELIKLIKDSETNLRENSPDKAEAFSIYSNNLYDYLFKFWDSPTAVNSAQTDAFFEVKHNFQNALYGEKQARGWEGWNQHFLNKILETAGKNVGKRILVTVGAEHAYWLRKKLRENKEVKFIEPSNFLFL